MNIVFIGCVEFSLKALESVFETDANITGIVTRSASSFNADFVSLEPIASKKDIPCYLAKGNDQESMANWIKDKKPDVIFCFGWSYLLGEQILSLSRLGVIGYHPAELPQNRGRHPVIWALALGLKHTASTFFFMDAGADTGDILSQKRVDILDSYDAGILYSKLIDVASEQIINFTPQLDDGSYKRMLQDSSNANSWRKRGKDDGKIDWRMSASNVHNLVRALTRPYVGAHFSYGGYDVKVWKVLPVDDVPENYEPGKILSVAQGSFTIKCGEGAVEVQEYDGSVELVEGGYL